MAYQLTLPPKLSRIHDVLYVSMLHKYILDPSDVLKHQPVQVRGDMMYKERLERIINWKRQELRTRTIPWVKVQWSNPTEEEAT